MIDDTTKELIAAYFQGGNAEGKSHQEIQAVLETIKGFVDSSES